LGPASPCTEWDARGVVEHVIGFHDVMLLNPFDAKPERPRDDPAARWALTAEAIFDTLPRPGVLDGEVEVPGMGRRPLDRLLVSLTTDVLVHTWDLGRAVGEDPVLDPELCRAAYETAVRHEEAIRSSGMFGPAVSVPDDADVRTRMLAFFGRDPAWQPG
jgi:uncharacterized protein (TIGR03086 family)